MDLKDMFRICILPIWDYGNNDGMVQRELFHMLSHIRSIANTTAVKILFHEVTVAIERNEL